MSDRDIQITLNARVNLPPLSQKRPSLLKKGATVRRSPWERQQSEGRGTGLRRERRRGPGGPAPVPRPATGDVPSPICRAAV